MLVVPYVGSRRVDATVFNDVGQGFYGILIRRKNGEFVVANNGSILTLIKYSYVTITNLQRRVLAS